MDASIVIVALVIGLAIGAAAAALFLRRGNRLAIDAALATAGTDAQVRLATAEARLAERDADVRDLGARLEAAVTEVRASHDALADVRVAKAGIETELHEERERAVEKLATLTHARDELSAHFKALAGDALELNRQRMADQHQGALDQILKPLGEKLVAFEKKVEETYDKEAQQRFSLQEEVKNLHLATTRINEDANNLTRALKGEAKTRGNWGEVLLERVLERSGLVKGTEYEIQFALKGDDGGALRPDVVVRLPDNKHIVIDSKVSLVAYDRYYAAIDDEGRSAAGRQHVDAIRKHAKELGAKGYQGREGLDTPDFVAMFVPIEPALGLASSLDESLFLDAWDRKVVIVTPSTLLAVLTTVHTLWQREKQTKNAIEIAEKAGALFDQFTLVIESIDSIGTHLERAGKAFEMTRSRLADGKGNLVKRIDTLRKMGAKAGRQLPAGWLARAGDDDEEPDVPAASKLSLVSPPGADAESR
ncbi:MAG: DNA recombination protein RmuC [Burkholderiaceae bacterium]